MPDLPTNLQLEARTLRIIEAARLGHPLEDSTVEVKSQWPDPKKIARQLAGHANSARGEPILWIIGLDLKQRRVTSPDAKEVASWWPAVAAQFEGLAPALLDLNVPVDAAEWVTSLLFDTSRAPFVIKSNRSVEYEVPWREGTGTRSARRSELVQLLVPVARTPEVEIIKGSLSTGEFKDRDRRQTLQKWDLAIELYISPRGEQQIVVPFHRCRLELHSAQLKASIQFSNIKLEPPTLIEYLDIRQKKLGYQPPDKINLSKTMEVSAGTLLIRGPGKAHLSAQAVTDSYNYSSSMTLRLTGELAFDPGSIRIPILVPFSYRFGGTGEWEANLE